MLINRINYNNKKCTSNMEISYMKLTFTDFIYYMISLIIDF